MFDMINLHFVLGLVLAAMMAMVVVSNWAPSKSQSEVVPVSVRENPASYRPSYVIFTGWRSRTSTSGGGGYRYGK